MGHVPLNEPSRAQVMINLSHTGGGYRLGKFPFVKRSEISMEKISCKMFRFCLNCGAMVQFRWWESRPYNEPNAQFLESVKRRDSFGAQRLVHGGQVNLDLEDSSRFRISKPRLFKAFGGVGKKLVSLHPEIVSTPSQKRIINTCQLLLLMI